jgi:hypothetical protein
VIPPRPPGGDVDALFAELIGLGEAPPSRIAAVFTARSPDEESVLALLRRALPVATLEFLGRTPPWSERSRVLAGVVLNPKAPPRLSLPLTDALPWRSLADVAVSPRVPSAVRMRAEAALKEKLPGLRLGDRISLGRLATPALLTLLLVDPDARVLESSLLNPRLRESDLLTQLRRPEATTVLFEGVGGCTRWLSSYAVRLTMALEPRCPLGVALAQLTSLLDKDLQRLADASTVAPLVQMAAQRVAGERQAAARDGGSQKKP